MMQVNIQSSTADDLRTFREAIELVVVIASVDLPALYALRKHSFDKTSRRRWL